MVTKAAMDKLASRIGALASIIDPAAGAIVVAVFTGETPEFALQRHCELRPEHRGRRVQYDWRPNKREELHERAAIWPARRRRTSMRSAAGSRSWAAPVTRCAA